MEPAKPIDGVCRYFESARHLKPSQLAHWLARRTLGRSYAVPHAATVALRPATAMSAPVTPPPTLTDGEEFRFLNVAHRFPGRLDWNCPAMSKLWRYNLHYFDYALDPGRPTAWVEALMADWILQNPPQRSDGWDPYPVSLRVVNWIKFALCRCQGEALGEKPWLVSLQQQIAWLERNIEKEILANHILKNAKALTMGGALFAGTAADRWLEKGLRLLLREAEEQFLHDGGHYERSPMYHAIAVEDLVDILNLSIASPGLIPEAATARLKEKALAGLRFLEELCYPDDEIPLFNDAAFAIAAKVETLSAYGARIIGHRPLAHGSAPELIDMPSSGYFGYRAGEEMLLIDAGPLGPAYQPGHGHCDMLSFELVLDGRRIFVDSGVYGYEDDALRRRLRSTAAHNTVRLDGQEQSDIWGSFRVGRRAHPIDVSVAAQLPERFHLSAAHDGYRHLRGRPIHQRVFKCDIGRRWEIVDRIAGRARHQIESFLHIHPQIQATFDGDAFALCDCSGSPICRVRVNGGEASLIPSSYCPEFGVHIPSQTICIVFNGELPVNLGYTIERA